MKAARLPFPPPEKYWAENVVKGVGRGTRSLLSNTASGVRGILYEPYIGAKTKGIKGGGIGVFKGIGGFVFKPIRGCFDFVAQPVAGFINTPNFIYKKMKVKKDPT